MVRELRIASIVTILALAILAPAATAEVNQTMNVSITPAKLSPKKRSPARLRVATRTTAPGIFVSAATRTIIYFDRDMSLNTKGVPRCRLDTVLLLSAVDARKACKSSMVGQGTGLVAPAGVLAGELQATASVFNGVPDSKGHPVLLLHSWEPTTGTTVVLPAVIEPSDRPGFGLQLNIAVPVLPFSSAITGVDISVQHTTVIRKRRSGSVKKVRRGFVSARCSTPATPWKFAGHFEFKSPEPPQDLATTMACRKRQ